MLLKPVNPSPVHTAIDASVDNVFSCEIPPNQVQNARLYIYDENGNIVTRDMGSSKLYSWVGSVKNNKVTWQIEKNILQNNRIYNWETVISGGFPITSWGSLRATNGWKEGDTTIKISVTNTVQGNSRTINTGDSHGFRTSGGTQFLGCGYFANKTDAERYSSTLLSIKNDLENGTDELSYSIHFYSYNNKYLKSMSIKSIDQIYINESPYYYDGITVNYQCTIEQYTYEAWMNEVSINIINSDTANFGVGDFITILTPSGNESNVLYKVTSLVVDNGSFTLGLSHPLYASSLSDTQELFYIKKDCVLCTTSPEYYFRARPTPSFNFADSFGSSISDIGYTLPRHFNTFFIKYTGAELGEYQITVSAENKKGDFEDVYKTDIVYNPIFETHNTYGEVLRFVYDGFVSGVTYKIEVTGKTVEGDIVTPIQAIFDVEYSTNTSSDITLEGRGCYTDIKLSNPWESGYSGSLNANNTLIIYRKSRDGLCLQKVCEGEMSSLEDLGGYKYHIKDYNIASRTEYTYYFAVRSTETEDYQYNSGYYLGFPIYESQPVNAYIDEHFVVGLSYNDKDGYVVDKNNVWSFGLNTEIGAYKHNYDKTTFDSFGRYAALSTGNRNYVDFPLSALLGDVTCDSGYYDDIDMINSWDAFCASPSIKLYKEPKGRIMLVETTGMETENSIFSNELPTTIKANFVQIGDTYNIPIYTWELMA